MAQTFCSALHIWLLTCHTHKILHKQNNSAASTQGGFHYDAKLHSLYFFFHLFTSIFFLVLFCDLHFAFPLDSSSCYVFCSFYSGSSHQLCRDLSLLFDPALVNTSFKALPKEANGFPANQTLQAFLAANFGTAGSDFENAVPDDFSSEPENFLPNVTDPAIRQWALAVNDLWQDLCREVCTSYTICCFLSRSNMQP